MTAYGAQDCPRALKALAQVPAGNEDASAARFYSGVCSANLGDFRAAEEQLRSVASASGSGLEEQALYYMAQIALARNGAPRRVTL